MAATPEKAPKKGTSFWRYVKDAFLYRWNVLLFGGAAAAALISGAPEVALPLVAAAELVYLTTLTGNDRFRSAIDARVHREEKGPEPEAAPRPQVSLVQMLAGLPGAARARFLALRRRCEEMGALAHGVAGGATLRRAGQIDRSKLDRLLWAFLRLLYSKTALDDFLSKTDRAAIDAQITQLRAREVSAREEGDERILRSLVDSIATAELRLANYDRAERNAEFVAIELDRIEGKTQALTEMAISHEDPDYISNQVDSVADSMASAELAIREIQHLTGLSDDAESAPAIMDADVEELVVTA